MADTDLAQYENFDFKESNSNIDNEDNTTEYANNSAITNGYHDKETVISNPIPVSSHSNNSSSKNHSDPAATLTGDSSSLYTLPDQHTDHSDTDSLQLDGGHQLLEESGTETTKANLYTINNSSTGQTVAAPGKQTVSMASPVISMSNGTGTAKARAAKSPYSSPPAAYIPETDISIPNDSNISSFTCDELANFLRCFNVEKKIISHLYRKNVDGKRFSRLKDSELESLGMKNPVIVFFRDRSSAKPAKKKHVFVL
ncbi:hypothetical protein ElyMa_005701700 [Elysia marginata]|uniref:SAM domain-containing protein n=1 Tax=Elysia marginata TaxID=1093978 RepID=A0AAV4FHC7_9GAST|nr:hypothetical protein ElyMa_005701700 [Elysia marginata]